MGDIDCIRLHLEIAEVAKRTRSDMPSIVNFKDALSRLETIRAELAAMDERIAGLEAVVHTCDAELGKIVEETKCYEQSHLRRVWKLAREARSAAKAALDE